MDISGERKQFLQMYHGNAFFADGSCCFFKIQSIQDRNVIHIIVSGCSSGNKCLENLTGIQYLNFIADVFEISAEEREKSIKKYADLFEITDALGDLISSYSHGMKQKAAIISALIHKPRLLVLDEPFVGLDPKASFILKEIMREMCAQGTAIFFSTHVLDVAEKLCNKIAIIRKGRIIASGATEELTGGQSLEEVFLEAVDEEKHPAA